MCNAFFTSITTCYLPKARVLAKTLKIQSKYRNAFSYSRRPPLNSFIKNEEPFDYIWNAEDYQTKANEVIYLDPDIAVYSNLVELHDMLN